MAITTGVRRHLAWVEVSGGRYLVTEGSVEQTATRKSATFNGILPMSTPGAMETFANLGDNDASMIVQAGGGEATLVQGEIDACRFDMVGRTISFSGRCKSAKLHATKASEKWNNKKSDEIVQDLAGRVGLSVDATGSTLAGKLWQIDWAKLSDSLSYAHVVHQLAELEGARWWVKNGTLFFKTDDSGQGSYTINYSAPGNAPVVSDAMRLEITRNVQAGKTIKVNVKSWHQKKKQVFEGTSTIGGNGGTTNYQYHVPGLMQDHVDKHAKSKAKEHARDELSLQAELVGDPSIDVAMKLTLTGTGVFDQDYDMDAVSHHFGMRGYTMSISAKSAKQGRSAS